jgi:hypothetical protein
MIDKLYGKYFQKSKSFLYPALGIKRTSSTMPSGTYVSLNGKIEPEDVKLICTFQQTDSEEFKIFEEQMLLSNPLFVEKISIKDYNLYVFDLEIYQKGIKIIKTVIIPKINANNELILLLSFKI